MVDDDVVENFWKFWETEINVFVVDRGNFFSFQNFSDKISRISLRLRECSSIIADSEISSSRWATGLHWTESSCCWSPFLSIVCDSVLGICCCCCCCTLKHGLRTTLWHFLCTRSLHWMHLNPCRPSPQIRSWQNAQNARYGS